MKLFLAEIVLGFSHALLLNRTKPLEVQSALLLTLNLGLQGHFSFGAEIMPEA